MKCILQLLSQIVWIQSVVENEDPNRSFFEFHFFGQFLANFWLFSASFRPNSMLLNYRKRLHKHRNMLFRGIVFWNLFVWNMPKRNIEQSRSNVLNIFQCGTANANLVATGDNLRGTGCACLNLAALYTPTTSAGPYQCRCLPSKSEMFQSIWSLKVNGPSTEMVPFMPFLHQLLFSEI